MATWKRIRLIAAIGILAVCVHGGTATAQQAKDGKHTLAVACKWNDAVIFYDAVTGQEQTKVAIGHRPHEMALAAGGALAYVSLYGTDFYYDMAEGGRAVAILDVAGRKKTGEIDLGKYRRPHGIEVGHRTGLLYITCDRPAALLVLDPKSKTVQTAIDLADGKALPHMVALSPDERTAYVANSGNGTVSVIDLVAKKDTTSISIGGVPMGMAQSADGQTLFATNRTANGVAVIDTAAGKVKRIIEISGQPVRAALTPDERHLLVTLIDSGELAVVDARELTLVRRLPVGQRVEGLFIDAAGENAYAAAQADNKVVKISLRDWQPVLEFKAGDRPDPLLLVQP